MFQLLVTSTIYLCHSKSLFHYRPTIFNVTDFFLFTSTVDISEIFYSFIPLFLVTLYQVGSLPLRLHIMSYNKYLFLLQLICYISFGKLYSIFRSDVRIKNICRATIRTGLVYCYRIAFHQKRHEITNYCRVN